MSPIYRWCPDCVKLVLTYFTTEGRHCADCCRLLWLFKR